MRYIFTSTTYDQITLSFVKIQCLTSSSVLNTGTKLNLLIYSFNNVLTSGTSSSTIGLRPGVDVSAGNLNFLMKRDNGVFGGKREKFVSTSFLGLRDL
jgi:hypothetical protein